MRDSSLTLGMTTKGRRSTNGAGVTSPNIEGMSHAATELQSRTAAAVSVHTAPARSPAEIMEAAKERENSLARLLMAYIGSGLVFMLLPGTFLGVWNLLQISGRESAGSVSASWIQAHGHAQVFGWIGSFILGIGFYSIPKLQNLSKAAPAAWACWAMWTAGVATRWVANVYEWHWRVLLPVSAVLELAAFLIFFRAVSGHRPAIANTSGKKGLEPWIFVVISGCVGLMSVLALNLGATVQLALDAASPALPHVFDQRFLALTTWGFLVPFVWGFSSKWLPIFLGLKPIRPKLLLAAVAVNVAGIVLTFTGFGDAATALFLVAVILAIVALRMFEPTQQAAKTRGVHRSFTYFIRLAYGWLIVAAGLGVGAALWDSSGGIWGASRHALTVGFISVMVFCVGQRILPAFAGMRLLWSTRLMFWALVLLVTGCTMRVSCEILAYQGYANWAWSVLPVSAVLELAGVTGLAVNMVGTLLFQPSYAPPLTRV